MPTYMAAPPSSRGIWTSENLDMNKGINSLKGKIGLTLKSEQTSSSFVRGDALLPYFILSYNVSPYINGRLCSWCNMIYRLSYDNVMMRMEEGGRTRSQSYTQSLELIFSPWEKLNFSMLNDNWQILFTATNILNQKTYNYTLVDSERFTRSYTAYSIRPLNLLAGFFFKF